LNDVITALEEKDPAFASEEDQITISVLPPVEEGVTDEDSDASDDEVDGNFLHLPRKILNSQAEVSEQAEAPQPNSSSASASQPKRRKKDPKRKWTKSIPTSSMLSEPEAIFGPDVEGFLDSRFSSPLNAFLCLFSSDLTEEILQQSSFYAQQRGRPSFNATKEEFLCFLGILLVSGYHPVPFRRLYWSSDPDVHNALITEAMRRNRFDQFMQNLHFADNAKINSDKYYKVRPLFNELNQRFKAFPLAAHLSIDESIIKYYGKHSTKQFIRAKPIRFGYKLFSLASPKGYLHHAEPYCGADTKLLETSFGLGGNVVLSLAEFCHVSLGSKLFFDNWFTSLSLLDELKKRNIGGTGTIRADRCQNAPLPSKKDLEKRGRGSSSYACDGSNMIVRWCDNAVVSVATNCVLNEDVTAVPRWSRKDRKKIDVPMPKVIHQYNQSMGGVDLFDQFVSNYRIRIRSKKWWWPFFSWSVDACVVNSWVMFKSVKKTPIPLLEFRREIAQQILKQFGTPKRTAGRYSITYRPETTKAVRLDRFEHWPEGLPSRYSRCRQCGRRCSVACSKCNTPLHVECFRKFHES